MHRLAVAVLLVVATARVHGTTEQTVVYLNQDGHTHTFRQGDEGADRASWDQHDHPSERCTHTQLHEAAHVFLAPEQRSQPYYVDGWPFPARDTARVQVSYLLWIDWTAAPPTLELDELRPDVRVIEPRLRYVLTTGAAATVEAAAAAPAQSVDRVQRLHELHVDGPWVPAWPPVGRALEVGFALENRSPFMVRVLFSCMLLTYEHPVPAESSSSSWWNDTDSEWWHSSSSTVTDVDDVSSDTVASLSAAATTADWAASVWPTSAEESEVFRGTGDTQSSAEPDAWDHVRHAARTVGDQFTAFELVLIALVSCVLCGVCLASCLFCCAVQRDRRREREQDRASRRGLLSARDQVEMERVVASAVYAYARASRATDDERALDDDDDERDDSAATRDSLADDPALRARGAERRYAYEHPTPSAPPLPPRDSESDDDDAPTEVVLARRRATAPVYAAHERFRRRVHHHEVEHARRSPPHHRTAASAPRVPYWYARHRLEKVMLRGELCEYPLPVVRETLHARDGVMARLHDPAAGALCEYVAAVRGYVLRERRRDTHAAMVLLYDTDVRFTPHRVDEMPLAAHAQERWPAAGYLGVAAPLAQHALAAEFHVYCQMVRAVGFLHARGVCARVLHPDSFVVQAPPSGATDVRCRLTVLAHCRRLPTTTPGGVLDVDEERDAVMYGGLDAQYAAPELLQPQSGRFAGACSDVWSLAMCVAALHTTRCARGPYAATAAASAPSATAVVPGTPMAVGAAAARVRADAQRDERRRVHAQQCRDPRTDALARPALVSVPACARQHRELHDALHACWSMSAPQRATAAEFQTRLDTLYVQFAEAARAAAPPASTTTALHVVGHRRRRHGPAEE